MTALEMAWGLFGCFLLGRLVAAFLCSRWAPYLLAGILAAAVLFDIAYHGWAFFLRPLARLVGSP